MLLPSVFCLFPLFGRQDRSKEQLQDRALLVAERRGAEEQDLGRKDRKDRESRKHHLMQLRYLM